ncbi:MAG: hypothetical protein HKN14_12835 [Marinicaulis sp.]|nr:hypothetical protein [Marinicaulis sp.]
MRDQNWFAVFLDFIIVVVGVFIGIQVANWNDGRQLRQTTLTYYERLIDDLEAERTTQRELTAYYRQVKQHGLATLGRLQSGKAAPTERYFIDAYQASQVRTYTPQNATYNELLSAGIASAIPDADLRGRLANYYLTLKNSERVQAETTPYRSNLRTYMPYDLQALIRERCKEEFYVQDDGMFSVDLSDDCSLDADSELLERSLAALETYDAMELELGRHLSDIDLKLTSLAIYERATVKTLKALIEELD